MELLVRIFSITLLFAKASPIHCQNFPGGLSKVFSSERTDRAQKPLENACHKHRKLSAGWRGLELQINH
jgi:hypothetical protein